MKKIAALVPNVLNWAPGQRVRVETWAKHLPEYGWQVDIYPFESDALHEVLYEEGNIFSKMFHMSSCFIKQLNLILKKPECDILLIHREASLIGPAIIERLAKRLIVPIIFDYDDPIFLNLNSVNSLFTQLKFPGKIHTTFKLSDHIIAINNIMGDYAKKYNPNVSVVPNVVDPKKFCPLEKEPDDQVKLGWTGSFSTMHNLKAISEPLKHLQKKYDVPVRVVGNGNLKIEGVDLDVREWTPETEVSDLQDCSIGLMPLVEHPSNKWKFFLKVVQYLAIGLPVIAHDAGSNKDVIEDGVNGFIVESDDEWIDRISLLIEDSELRKKMSNAARQTALENFTPEVQMPRIAKIFEDVLAQSTTKK